MGTVAPGKRNLLTDVRGLKVGNAEDLSALTGVTVVLPDEPAVAAADVRGGAPGTRETDALLLENLVERIHGIVLSGGSVFGLDAASAVTEWLATRGRGFRFGAQPHPSPVVPAAVLFDLINGGDKGWQTPPYRDLGRMACGAAGEDFAIGNAGAGLGATAGIFKGGLGSASCVWQGIAVGALVAVNSFGSPADPSTGALWAQPFLLDGEAGSPAPPRADRLPLRWSKAEVAAMQAPGANTTIALVATDAALTRAEAKRLAIMAADGMARALRPVHTPFDGDTVFALSTGVEPLPEPRPLRLAELGTLAADTLARAVARGVWEAKSTSGWQSYRERLGITI